MIFISNRKQNPRNMYARARTHTESERDGKEGDSEERREAGGESHERERCVSRRSARVEGQRACPLPRT